MERLASLGLGSDKAAFRIDLSRQKTVQDKPVSEFPVA